MPIFEYSATDAQGQSVRGTVIERDLAQAASNLAEKGLTIHQLQAAITSPEMAMPTVARLAPVTEAPRVEHTRISSGPTGRRNFIATEVWGPMFGRVKLSDLLFFFRQSSTMLDAGISPAQAFTTLSGQAQSPKFSRIIRELATHASEGRPMSFGLQRYPEVFSPLIVSLVRAGEEGGFVDSVLAQIADYIEQEINLRGLIRRVTIYPKLVLAASIVVLTAANLIIRALAPNSPISLSSPLTTPATWIWLGPLLIGLFLFFRVGLHNPRIKFNYDLIVTNLPFVGKTMRQFAMAKFGRALGALYKGGVPIHVGFKLSADACGNEYLRAKMYPAFSRLDTGAGITETLRSTGAFDPIVLDMTATGEQTGNLDQMLQKMAQFYEGEAETRAIQMGHFIGVLALLLVASYVAYIYISNLAGVFQKTYQGNLENL